MATRYERASKQDPVGPIDPKYTKQMTSPARYFAYWATGFGFAAIGGLQLIYRRSILKVDKEILLLGALYVVTVIFYILFEKVIVNYRPILMPDGEGLEASFPSSHTMLSCVILGSGLELLKKYARKDKTIQTALTAVFAVMLALIVAGRLLSGVHWFTDILGGILLSVALLNAWEALLKLWKSRK